MVSVFKTNVQCPHKAVFIISGLLSAYPAFRINFDLEDCDRILRVEGSNIEVNDIIAKLEKNGYLCEELPYCLT